MRVLLYIFSFFWRWNNFENRLIFDEDKAYQKDCAVFGPPCRPTRFAFCCTGAVLRGSLLFVLLILLVADWLQEQWTNIISSAIANWCFIPMRAFRPTAVPFSSPPTRNYERDCQLHQITDANLPTDNTTPLGVDWHKPLHTTVLLLLLNSSRTIPEPEWAPPTQNIRSNRILIKLRYCLPAGVREVAESDCDVFIVQWSIATIDGQLLRKVKAIVTA